MTCQDCRHVHVAEDGGSPRCHHPKSLKEYPDYFTLRRRPSRPCGRSATAARTLNLFEPASRRRPSDAESFANFLTTLSLGGPQ